VSIEIIDDSLLVFATAQASHCEGTEPILRLTVDAHHFCCPVESDHHPGVGFIDSVRIMQRGSGVGAFGMRAQNDKLVVELGSSDSGTIASVAEHVDEEAAAQLLTLNPEERSTVGGAFSVGNIFQRVERNGGWRD
jgi:hypothetical protein